MHESENHIITHFLPEMKMPSVWKGEINQPVIIFELGIPLYNKYDQNWEFLKKGIDA